MIMEEKRIRLEIIISRKSIDGWFYIQAASKMIIHHILIFDQFVSPNHIEDSVISVVDSHITQGSTFRVLGYLPLGT